MNYLETHGYRIASIFNIMTGEQLAKYGLALEKKGDADEDHWHVICFVKYDEKERSAKLEPVWLRLLEIDGEEWKIVKVLLDTAVKIVTAANIEE